MKKFPTIAPVNRVLVMWTVAAAIVLPLYVWLSVTTSKERLPTKIASAEQRQSICRALGTSSWSTEQCSYLLIAGYRPDEKDFDELLKHLDEAKAAALEWREAEGK